MTLLKDWMIVKSGGRVRRPLPCSGTLMVLYNIIIVVKKKCKLKSQILNKMIVLYPKVVFVQVRPVVGRVPVPGGLDGRGVRPPVPAAHVRPRLPAHLPLREQRALLAHQR